MSYKMHRPIKAGVFSSLTNNEDKIMLLLNYGVLAPSTHNTQPWLFKLGDSYCDVFLNEDKSLPIADKSHKNMHISVGCCIENIIIAAKYYGVFRSLKLDIRERKIARISFNFKKSKAIDKSFFKLFSSITKRQNKRGVYVEKIIPHESIEKLTQIRSEYPRVKFNPFVKPGDIQIILKLALRGTEKASSDPEFREELSRWIINNFSSKKVGMPGYLFNIPGLVSLFFPTLVKYINPSKVTTRILLKNFNSAGVINLIGSVDKSKKSLVQIGRFSQRLMLEYQSLGIGTYITASATEYKDVRNKLRKILNLNYEPHFLFTAGYVDKASQFSPRESPINLILK